MIIQKTYRLEKFIDSVLPVECMSQPPALRATSFQRKEGKAAFVRHVQGAYRTC